MKTTELKTPIVLPKQWQDLLNMTSFEELPDNQFPKKFRSTDDVLPNSITHVYDPTPFRDDARSVSLTEGDYTITYFLHSGDSNYWLSNDVTKNDEVVYESEPTDNLPSDNDEADLKNEEILSWKVQMATSHAHVELSLSPTPSPSSLSNHH